jgi:hypothetical protein
MVSQHISYTLYNTCQYCKKHVHPSYVLEVPYAIILNILLASPFYKLKLHKEALQGQIYPTRTFFTPTVKVRMVTASA